MNKPDTQVLTPAEAWADFFQWAFLPENKARFSVDNRHYFHKTEGDMKRGVCGAHRIRNILNSHRPGHYHPHELHWFTVVDVVPDAGMNLQENEAPPG